MTTCYFVSDLHGKKQKFEMLAKEIARNKPPFLFIGGDILPFIRISDKKITNTENPFIREYLIPLFTNLQKQLGCNYPEVYLILGNDDYKADIPGFVYGQEKDLWKFLNSSKVKFGPYMIYGYSYVPPTPFRIKDWEKYDIDRTINPGCQSPEEGFKSVLSSSADTNLIAEDITELCGDDSLEKAIMIMHSPPYGCNLDQMEGNVSIGSKAIARFIEEKQPYITLHGHVHESSRVTGQWHQQFGRTHSFSAAWDGEELALVIFQIDNPVEHQRKILTP